MIVMWPFLPDSLSGAHLQLPPRLHAVEQRLILRLSASSGGCQPTLAAFSQTVTGNVVAVKRQVYPSAEIAAFSSQAGDCGCQPTLAAFSQAAPQACPREAVGGQSRIDSSKWSVAWIVWTLQ